MADISVTQQAVEGLYEADADVRATQQAVEALYQTTADLRVTQQAVEALWGPSPDLRVTQQALEVVRMREADAPYTDGPPTAGEDPCTQRTFEAWLELETDTASPPTTITASTRPIHTHPTGYHEGQYGPYKPALVVSFGKALRALTDRDRGDWRGGRFAATVADSGHTLKTALLAHPTQGRGATGRAYVVSVDGGRTGTTPWHWYGGPLLSWEPQHDASLALEFGDQVGHVLGGVLGADRQLPKRRITATDFPNAPAASLGLPVPIVYWSHRTVSGIEGVPLVYVGTRVMADANTWHEWVAAGHALKQFTYLNLDNVTIVAGWGTAWAMPGQSGWATVTGATAAYRDYNGRRYACVYGRGADADAVAAGTARLSLECYGVEDRADGTGGLIGGAVGTQTLHWFVNWVLGDYQGGAWLPMPTYDTGWAQVDATAFTAIDALATARLGGPSYAMSLYFGVQQLALPVTSDLVSIRDAIAWVARSADIRIGLNTYSQWTAAMLPDTVVTSSLPLYGDQIPARILASSWQSRGAFDAQWTRCRVLAHRSYRPPVVEGTTDWLGTETVINTALETSLGAIVEGPTLELPFAAVYDNVTLGDHAQDVADRVLARHALPARTFTWETTRCGASKTDLGQLVRLSHHAYPGPRRVLVESMETGLTSVVMTGQDVTDLVLDAGSEGSA